MDADTRKDHDTLRREDEEVKVPRRIQWEIRDLVHPIILRRVTLWRAGLVLLALVVGGFAAWFFFFRPPSGEALLADAVEAAGGMENWQAVEEGVFTRVHTHFDEAGEPVDSREEQFYFRKGEGDFNLVIEAQTEESHVLIGRDEEGYWATLDGEPVAPVSVAQNLGMMCEDEACTPLCGAEMAFYRFTMPFKLTDPGVSPRNAGTATLNGVPVYLLEITYAPEVGSDRWVLYLDQESKLIRKIEHYASAEGDAPPEEIFWADHQTEDGITFSRQRSYYRSNGNKLEEYVITDADFRGPLSDELFTRPKTLENASLQP